MQNANSKANYTRDPDRRGEKAGRKNAKNGNRMKPGIILGRRTSAAVLSLSFFPASGHSRFLACNNRFFTAGFEFRR